VTRFWTVWGGLLMWLVGGLVSIAMVALYAYHDFDKRLTVVEVVMSRIERKLDTAAGVSPAAQVTSTSGTR